MTFVVDTGEAAAVAEVDAMRTTTLTCIWSHAFGLMLHMIYDDRETQPTAQHSSAAKSQTTDSATCNVDQACCYRQAATL